MGVQALTGLSSLREADSVIEGGDWGACQSRAGRELWLIIEILSSFKVTCSGNSIIGFEWRKKKPKRAEKRIKDAN